MKTAVFATGLASVVVLAGCNPLAGIPLADTAPVPDCGPSEVIAADGFATIELICLEPGDVPFELGTFWQQFMPISIQDDGSVLVNDSIWFGTSDGAWTAAGSRGLIYKDGVWTGLAAGEVFGVGADGSILGDTQRAKPSDWKRIPTIWRGGKATKLPVLKSGEEGAAYSMNSAGVVVGVVNPAPPTFYLLPPPYEAFPVIWQSDGDRWTVTALGDDSYGTYLRYSNPPNLPKINERGQVLLGTSNGIAAIWENGTLTPIGPNDSLQHYGVDINNLGHVAGVSDTHDFAEQIPLPDNTFYHTYASRAALFHDGINDDLGTLGGLYSEALALNDADVVIGTSETTELADYCQNGECDTHVAKAFVHRGGKMTALSELLPPSIAGARVSVIDINNANQILATVIRIDENGDWNTYTAIITLPAE